MADRLGVRLLGDFRLDGVDVDSLRSRQARVLLKRLALGRGAPVGADELLDAVWPAARPAQPDRDLHVLVSRARTLVGADRVPRTDRGYALRADWWDVVELEALAGEAVRRADIGDLAGARMAADGALGLVRGPLLSDEPDADWARDARAAAAATVTEVRGVAALAALEGGHVGAAAAHASDTLRDDPYDEAALRVLMRALATAGRPASALAEFARVRQLLAEDLGVDPAPETRALHEQLLRADTAPVAEAVQRTGGADDLATIDAQLEIARARVRIVLVTGMDGAGKSALLDRWGAAAEARGVVVLRGHGERGRLGLQPVIDALTGRAADLRPDQWSASGGLPGPGATPDALTEAVFTRLDDAVRTFRSDHGAALLLDDADDLDPLTWAWLARIRRRGSPYLLVVAAVREEGLARVAADAVVDLDRGGSGAAALPDDTLDRWRETGDAAPTLQAAAVLGASIDLELLAATVGLSALETLDHLDIGLRHEILTDREGRLAFRQRSAQDVLATEAGAARRAWLHRRAAEVLQARPDADPVELARHARDGGDRSLATAALAQAAELSRARLDLSGAEAFLDEAITIQDGTDLRLRRSRLRMARGDLDGADADAEVAMAGDATGEALELRAWAARNRHDLGGAIRLGRAAADQATDPAIRCSSLIAVAFGHRGNGDLERADAVLREAEGAPPELGLPAWTGVLRVHQGRPTDALATLEPMLGVDARRGMQGFWVEHTLQMTAHAYGLLGRTADALRVVDRLELELGRRGTAVRYAGVQHTYRSWILRNLGDPSALDVAEAGLAIAGSQEIRAQSHLDLADCLLRAGDLAGAAERLDRAATESGTRWFHNTWRFDQRRRLLLARVALAERDADTALEHAETVSAGAEARGDERYSVLGRLVRVAALAGTAQSYDEEQLGSDLDSLDELAALEGWWLAADLADATGLPRARATATRLADHVARESEERGAAFRSVVAARLG